MSTALSMRDAFASIPVVISDYLPCRKEFRQVRFPKSKGKRIRKKWAKNKRRNWRTVDAEPVFIQINGTVYCNLLGMLRLKKGLAGSEGSYGGVAEEDV